MAKIIKQIQEQGFEIVRDTIAAILKTELEHQKTAFTPSRIQEEIKVYTGRTADFQQAEILMINVLLESGNYSTFTEAAVAGATLFSIDIYCSAKQTDNETGGLVATRRRDKFTGLVRSILSDTHYYDLGLPKGLVLGRYVEGFDNYSGGKEDTSFVKMSRVVLSVRLSEDQSMWEGVNISEIFTSVKLEHTDKGYKF